MTTREPWLTVENLDDNEYVYKSNFSFLEIHAKDNHRLLLQEERGKYNVYGNYLFDKEGSFQRKKLYQGIQLDLFYNKY